MGITVALIVECVQKCPSRALPLTPKCPTQKSYEAEYLRRILPLCPRARVCRRSVRLRITTHMREGERERDCEGANCGTRPSL